MSLSWKYNSNGFKETTPDCVKINCMAERTIYHMFLLIFGRSRIVTSFSIFDRRTACELFKYL